MNGTYNDNEPHQEITLTIRFKIKQSPDNESHLKNLMKLNNHYIKGSEIYEEGGRLIYEI